VQRSLASTVVRSLLLYSRERGNLSSSDLSAAMANLQTSGLKNEYFKDRNKNHCGEGLTLFRVWNVAK